MRSSINCAFI